jgi:ADP-ribose pyrophosphatase YjhB (NUDIX family)
MSRMNARAIIEYGGKYLLVRQKSSNGAFWCLPGGGIEAGEDIISALERELIEEVGVKPVVGNLLFVHQIKDTKGYSLPGFYFHVSNGKDYLHVDTSATTHGELELLEVAFVDIQRVNVLPKFLAGTLPALARLEFNAPTQVMVTTNEE